MTTNSTTPRAVSSDILELCKKILPDATPVFVPVEPAASALQNECFPNVDHHVAENGGQSVIGWQIWEWPGVFVEAEFHAVWRQPDGKLIDITPKNNRERSVLFVPDQTREYTGARVPNIKHPIAKGEIVRDYIRLLDILFGIHEHFSERGNRMLAHHRQIFQIAGEAIETVKFMLVKGRTTKGKCACGSRFAYGDCHRQNVKDAIESLTRLATTLKQ